jgi:membrane protein DedA with SNARE-associated domain
VEQVLELINTYSYAILFFSLMLELIALPIPTEPLMAYVGYLVFKNQMSLSLSILTGIAGSITGMAIAYFIGLTMGSVFLRRYGRFIHLNSEKLDKFSLTFNKSWKRMLLFAYFIPGVRHLTGYTSGITKIQYRYFALYSYIGLTIWVGSIVTLGYLLGPHYKFVEHILSRFVALPLICLVVIFVLYKLINKIYPIKIPHFYTVGMKVLKFSLNHIIQVRKLYSKGKPLGSREKNGFNK